MEFLKCGWDNVGTENMTSCFIASQRIFDLKKLQRSVLVVGAWSFLSSLPFRDVFPCHTSLPVVTAWKNWYREKSTQSEITALPLTANWEKRVKALISTIICLSQEPITNSPIHLQLFKQIKPDCSLYTCYQHASKLAVTWVTWREWMIHSRTNTNTWEIQLLSLNN